MNHNMTIADYEIMKKRKEEIAEKVSLELLDVISVIYPDFEDIKMTVYEKVQEKMKDKIIEMEVLK